MADVAPGTLIADRFEIERRIGSGGMGTVYGALDRHSGQKVALKLLHGAGDEAGMTRFEREAQFLEELQHPGIVAHVAHGETGQGQFFLAMEWLDGEDLATRLAEVGPLGVREAVVLMERIADALAVAHERGVVHRDLKPTNLFLPGGSIKEVKLLDFGIARQVGVPRGLTRTGLVLGTPAYMAPEQARGDRPVEPPADIFALGCVLYECLTGAPPFTGDHVVAVLMGILKDEPVRIEAKRPEVARPLAELSRRMLAKDPAARPADARALAQALAALTTVETQRAAVVTGARTGAFVTSEQFLYSVVVAAPPTTDVSQCKTLSLAELQTKPRTLESGVRNMGGQIDFLVDGTVVVTLPRAESAADQAGQAARAALLLKERWPEAAIGLATGRGSLRGEMAVGEVVERAARLLRTGTDKAGVICLDELSASLLQNRFVVSETGGRAVLVGEEVAVDESRPLLGKPTPCVGRDAELSTLEGQLTGCIENSEARAIIVTAPPGSGKSRLRHEFLRRVEKQSEPVTVLFGRGDLLSAGAAYGILARAILALCEVSGAEPPEEQRRRLRERVGRNVDAADEERIAVFLGELCGVPFPDEESPLWKQARQDHRALPGRLRQAALDWLAAECRAAAVLIVLDDLQWADELTVGLLDGALRELSGAPLCIVALARSEVHTVFPNLWQGHKRQDLALRGLSRRACERLIRQILGAQISAAAVARLIDQAGGNALYLEELIRAAASGKADGETETVVAMLQARVGRFETGPRRTALAACVYGQTFWQGGVAVVLGLAETTPEITEWLGVLVEAEIIQTDSAGHGPEDREYAFRHALVRDAVYGLLTEDDRKIGHHLAAEYLKGTDKPVPLAVLAHHLRLAGRTEEAVSCYLHAGDQAAQLYLHEEARTHYTAADETIVELPDTSARRRQHVDILLKRVHSGLTGGISPTAQMEALGRARSLLESLGDPAVAEDRDRLRLARVDYYLGRSYIYAGQPAVAAPHFMRSLKVAMEFGDQELTALASMFPGLGAAMNGRMRQAREALTLALGPMEQHFGHSIDTMRCCTYLGAVLAASGQLALAEQRIAEAEVWATQSRQAGYVGLYHLMCAIMRLFAADWAEAVRFGALSCDYSTKGGQAMHLYMALDVMAWSQSHLGRHEEALATRARAAGIRAPLGRTLGDDWFEAGESEILLNVGRTEDALEKARRVAESSRAAGLFYSLAVAERVCGCALHRLGASREEADAHLRASLEVCDQHDLVIHAIQAELWWGRLCREQGDEAGAGPHLDKAFRGLEAGGYQHALEWANRLAGVP